MRRLAIFGLLLLPLTLTLGCATKRNDSPDGSHGSLGTARGDGRDWSGPVDADASAKREAAPGSAPPASDGFGGGAQSEAAWDDAEFGADRIAVEEASPGLGTGYGETRRSSVETVGFRRADSSTPDVVFTVRYDDVDGVRSAARSKRTRAWSDEAMQQHAGLSFALLDQHGNILPAAAVGSELWAVGEPDARYSLAIANDTGSAFEVVASVDGLDVIDGRAASFSKRGYIVDPFSSVVIDGWRTSEDTVAAFRFSSLEDSYAERMGDGRNVGVIGAAFFRAAPQAWEEWRAPEETWRRDSADPFPGR
jgi:hypothetical protein